MKRIPILPTIFVALACLTMVGLGFWQVRRAAERDAAAQVYAANMANAEPVAFPVLPPVPDDALYRRSELTCLEVVGWQATGGTARDGTRGFRQIAQCRTGAEGPGVLIDMGVSADVARQPTWAGGTVTGRITHAPDPHSAFDRWVRNRPPPPAMLVADAPAPGLLANAPFETPGANNSSRYYAWQWFLFALAAAVIYALALRRRWRNEANVGAAVSASVDRDPS